MYVTLLKYLKDISLVSVTLLVFLLPKGCELNYNGLRLRD